MARAVSSSSSFGPWFVGGINDEHSLEEAREEGLLNGETVKEGCCSGTFAFPGGRALAFLWYVVLLFPIAFA
ncbi:hypothetical protein Nepgr_024536 [Nepenthes gracilis]|uniref:Uncharacterized protein n=1 Tax=Nepenthes gracilis TaxID=150966 RepID=A0AAD3XYW4_NEPGR|nr:hypothetical protein Nepgr_024536 [Nepenthes gracilis]